MISREAGAAALAVVLCLWTGLPGCTTQRPAEDMRVSAERASRLGDYETAASEYEQVIDRYPGDWRAQFGLGQCALELERWGQARQALSVAHELRPQDEQIADAYAEAIFRQGDESALFTFIREQADQTRSVYAYRRLARYSIELGDLDSASVALQTAIEIDDGSSVEPYLEAAAFAERIGDLDLAIRRLRQAYGIEPRDPRVRERLIALGEIPGPTLALPPGR